MRWLLAAAFLLLAASHLPAHEVRPAYLEFRQAESGTWQMFWKVPARGPTQRLALAVRLPDGCEVLMQAPPAYTGDAFIEKKTFTHPDGLTGQEIVIVGLRQTVTDVLVQIVRADGGVQTVRVTPEAPSFTVENSPGMLQVSWTYAALGIEHILLGVDHLLFVLGLLWIVKGGMRLVKTITSFTIAHSMSLALATFGIVNVPGPPVDACIALSIVFLGVEIVRARRGQYGLTYNYPWLVAFAFGLLHGLGFAGVLTGLGLQANEIPLALLFFNVGVEIGQLLFVAVFLLLLWSHRRLEVVFPKGAEVIPAYFVGSIAAFWLLTRLATMVA